uniref:MARVEL domain-containing protein n=1 Tax=Bionectria ochroleuca TaxID=29856 RepID=A0A8H7TMY9_BIOOC
MSAQTVRLPGREHIPDYPKGYVAVNVIQLIFSIILIGCSGFALAVLPTLAGVFIMISSLVSFAISIWLISARQCAPQAFNYWASIAFDVFLFVFYLIGWALSAIASIFWMGSIYGIVNAVMAVFGAFNWIMFIVALIVDAVVVARHRRAGLRNKPGLPVAATTTTVPQSKEEQYQMTPQPYPVQAAPAFQPVDPNAQYYAQQPQQPYPGQPPVPGQVPQYTVPAQQPQY